MRWQASKEDFDNGWIKNMLAQSHPHRLEVRLNIFTNEVSYAVIDLDGKLPTQSNGNFDKALKTFNERVY